MSEFEVLTYRQLGDRLGISLESARKKVRRRKWRVVPGNRPSDPVRVHVPKDLLDSLPPQPEADARLAAAGLPATDPPPLSTLKGIGRASDRERVCQSVYISVVPGTLKKKQTSTEYRRP